MEDTKKKEAVNGKRPRKLDLNAPLLSARRLVLSGGNGMLRTNSQGDNNGYARDRVPFAWEQEPGKPKVLESRSNEILPKGKHSPEGTTSEDKFKQDNHAFSYQDEDCDADMEDYEYVNKFGDVSWSHDDDAMDMQSLSEAIDYVERASKFQKLDSSKLKSHIECFKNDHQSHSFMMQRFLPDATALAESSTLANHLKASCLYSYPKGCISQSSVRKPIYSPRLCGLGTFFPWSIKHQPCGVKTPSCVLVQQAPTTPKNAKKLATLAHGSFTCPNKYI